VSIRVLLVDDETMIRAGFAMILGAHADMRIVGEAGDGQSAIEQTAKLSPDVIIMDIQMPKMDGIAAIRAIRAARSVTPKVLVVTTFNVDRYVYDSLRAGASGFLLKNAPPEELVHAVRVVAAGEALLSPGVTRHVIEAFCSATIPPRPPAALSQLTTREREVLQLVARGLSNAQISEQLVVGIGTVKTHVARILDKLDLSDRVQAVVLAYETGLVMPGQYPRDHNR
jgi:DNA-binding NarL/FixJ family response regulator